MLKVNDDAKVAKDDLHLTTDEMWDDLVSLLPHSLEPPLDPDMDDPPVFPSSIPTVPFYYIYMGMYIYIYVYIYIYMCVCIYIYTLPETQSEDVFWDF